MPELLRLQANHRPVKDYYASLRQYSLLHATHEGAVSEAFGTLLQACAKQFSWKLVNQYEIKRPKRRPLRVDGALVDPWSLPHGFWEAKDEHDDLAAEVKKKIDVGYPTDNILFQAPDRAILYRNGKRILDEPLVEAPVLVDVLKEFFRYTPAAYEQWEQAVDEFRDKVPQLAGALIALIEKERRENPFFLSALDAFVEVCRRALNPTLSQFAVERMLVQHILTERIFRKIFDNSDFIRRNVVAKEIENVVDALTRRSFNREKFLSGLDRFYRAIEATASTIEDFSEKQGFLNAVYENFFQGFDSKTADTHGIVYTPQPIVKFMVRSVGDILRKEFNRSLGDKGVHILDPFVGTGNFLLNVISEIPRTQLAHKYHSELHANEVMLLPYYIASMNIEHEYAERMGEYRPFEGLCLADTFELAEPKQQTFAAMTEKNAERVDKQRKSPIFAILGNPPYNAWQLDENDKNKNRKYEYLDDRIAKTYARDSAATLLNSLSDPYVKAFRWATERLGDEGIVAYVSNGSYVANLAFDGMRKHLAMEFDAIYVLDLGGNVRTNPKLSGTTHNVFGIQVGVAIGFFVRRRQAAGTTRRADIFFAKTGDDWRKEDKYKFLDEAVSLEGIEWKRVEPDAKHTWLREGLHEEFSTFMPLVAEKLAGESEPRAIFRMSSNGVQSNNDAYVYDFDHGCLAARAQRMVHAYNTELDRWRSEKSPGDVDAFLRVDEAVLKWVRKTKRYLARGERARFQLEHIVPALYRPFVQRWFFFDRMFNEDLYGLPKAFPPGHGNRCIAVSDKGLRSPFSVLAFGSVPERHLCASTDAMQVLPLLTYDEDGSNPQDNITDWALDQFRSHYSGNAITKEALFYYVYAVLHHPTYRSRYEADFRRELPRIPYATEFWAFAKAGERLVELHLNYDKQAEWPLRRIENPDLPLSWRVEKMKLTREKDSIIYNEFLTLAGVPSKAFGYRLGTRSAIEWIIDQYQVTTDRRSGIVIDPNRREDPEYVVRLIGQVVTISVETVKIVEGLPALGAAK
jgi:predicted helicase